MDIELCYYNKPKIYNTDPRYISNAPVRSSLDVLPQFNDAFSYWKHMRVLNITYIRVYVCVHMSVRVYYHTCMKLLLITAQSLVWNITWSYTNSPSSHLSPPVLVEQAFDELFVVTDNYFLLFYLPVSFTIRIT